MIAKLNTYYANNEICEIELISEAVATVVMIYCVGCFVKDWWCNRD